MYFTIAILALAAVIVVYAVTKETHMMYTKKHGHVRVNPQYIDNFCEGKRHFEDTTNVKSI